MFHEFPIFPKGHATKNRIQTKPAATIPIEADARIPSAGGCSNTPFRVTRAVTSRSDKYQFRHCCCGGCINLGIYLLVISHSRKILKARSADLKMKYYQLPSGEFPDMILKLCNRSAYRLPNGNGWLPLATFSRTNVGKLGAFEPL